MRKRRLAFGLTALIIPAAALLSLRFNRPAEEAVYTVKAERRPLEVVVTSAGRIDPKVKINISAHVVGKIEKLYFNEGDTVRRGQKLIELEKPLYLAERNRALADVATRRIEVRRARIELEIAEAAYARARSLHEQGLRALEFLEDARLAYNNAVAAVAGAEQGVRQAEAGLQQADEDLTRTTIVSPLDGKVVLLEAQEGEVVVPGTMNNAGSVIAVVADVSQIVVEAEVGEGEIVNIQPGVPARVKVEAVADHEYSARVIDIGSSAEPREGSKSGGRYFKVKLTIDDPDARLRPGMSAQVSIITSRAANVLAVPIQAVIDGGVFLAENGRARRAQVRTGASDVSHVTVLSGLKAGDEVITGPLRTLSRLEDGARIRPAPEPVPDLSDDGTE